MKIATLLLLIPLAACSADSIEWVDGDSGTLNGIDFRLANVEAAPNYKAPCPEALKAGKEAHIFAQTFTDGANITKSKPYSMSYGREVVDLNVNGLDMGTVGLIRGHYKAWPFEGGRATVARPEWCS